ncbi:MAG: hypothetical protein ACLGHN_02950 [Bacteriovoracia bacterium]
MKIAQLFILILAFLIINPVKAGVLIEPVVGYNFSQFEIDNVGFSEENANGVAVGGRLGYQQLGFQLGLDYLRSSLNVSDNDYKEDLVVSEFGGFVGFEFPILLRVYAGYIFSATGETEADFGAGAGKQELEFKDGRGAKFGVGFTGLPFIDINFEYRKGTFSEYKLGTTKVDEETSYNSFMVGLSLPFVL